MNLKLTMKPKTYNFYIMVVTAAVLTAIGLVCLYGIGYYTITTESMPNWIETPLYGHYIDSMNLYIYPFVVLLLVILGLCIPKRIVPRQTLLSSGAGILALNIIIALVLNIEASLGFLLGISIVIQTAVMILTIIKWGGLTFERDGYFIQVGSAMLHMGIVIFVFDFVIMRTSGLHLPLFWVATILITIGTVLSFYPEEIGRMVRFH
ncbi:MAG: hypothetical protein IBX40_00440 [Methanosarcinales archaeon]|nr:hypothetical protein [Methanosarcinales archaeon]